MQPPTAADIRAWSKLDFAALGWPRDDGPGGLQVLVARAIANFQRITGRALSQPFPAALPAGGFGAWLLIADGDPEVPLVQQAIQGLVEQQALSMSPDNIENLQDFETIQSFNAGQYSETRRAPDEMYKARLLVPWPALSSLLWELLTPDSFGYWTAFFTGQHVPAFDTQEVVWDHAAIGYGDAYLYPSS